jgi:hypothetical protein
MKKTSTVFLVGLLLLSAPLFAQSSSECYTIKNVENKTNIEGLNSKKYTFGIKQITEEILSEKKSICTDGVPVNVTVVSIEAPTNGINIGPFSIKKKITVVKVEIKIGEVIFEGEGESKLSVSSTFIELSDENLPFEQTVFSSALKKSLIDAINKI